jgi:hypothetical protein
LCRFGTLNRADLCMSDITRTINRKCLTQLRARDNVTTSWSTRGRASYDFGGTIVGETRLGLGIVCTATDPTLRERT